MPILPKSLILLALLVCAGCAKPSDISDARRDHILAGPHGWIDVTVHAPAAASAPVAASAPLAKACALLFAVNGEPMFRELDDLARADAAKSPLGYRIVAPAGVLATKLVIDGCVAQPLELPLPVTLEADHLALLQFDGQKLSLQSTQAWTPATLDAVRGDVAGLHEHAASTDDALGMLTKLAIASVLLNVMVVLGVMVVALRRRNAPADLP